VITILVGLALIALAVIIWLDTIERKKK